MQVGGERSRRSYPLSASPAAVAKGPTLPGMARVAFAVLCQSALAQPDGLISILGAGIDGLTVPGPLPVAAQVTAAAQVVWAENDLNSGHVFKFRVVNSDDESLAELRAVSVPVRPPGAHPGPIRGSVVVPVPMFLEQFGSYVVQLLIDDEVHASLPLMVTPPTPA